MVRKTFLTHFVTGIMIVSLHVPGITQSTKAEAEIQELMKQDVVGLSVAVVKGKNIVYTKAFGMKDLEMNKPLEEKDLFRIASVSKSFSATSVMQLVEA